MFWTIRRGPLPSDAEVAHRCGNLACCNIQHLVTGPAAVRTRLLVHHGRSVAGARHHDAKLTPAQVAELRSTKAAHPELTGRVLAARFGLRSAAWVNAILRGAGWREPQPTGAPANQEDPDSARQPRRRGSRRG